MTAAQRPALATDAHIAEAADTPDAVVHHDGGASAFDERRALRDEIDRLRAFNRDVAQEMISSVSSMHHLAALGEFALHRGDPARLETLLALMREEASSATALMDGLMTLTRQTPSLDPSLDSCEVVSLSTCVAKAQRTLILAGRHESTAATPVVVGNLPSVWGNESLLTQMFVNLIGNALKFSRRNPKGRVEVFAQEQDGEVSICVHDNGVGFDTDQVERIFDPFYRGHGASYAGHGLGLTVVRSIAERHGGRVTAESLPGRGARFSVALPVCSTTTKPDPLATWSDDDALLDDGEETNDEAQVAAWAHAFVATPDQVRDAVRLVGTDVQALGRYLLGLRPTTAQ